MAKVNVYRKSDGKKVLVPEHWIGHPVLGKPFRKTPLQRAADQKVEDDKPSTDTTKTPAAGDKKE